MDAFVSRKRRRVSPLDESPSSQVALTLPLLPPSRKQHRHDQHQHDQHQFGQEEDTETKLACLASLHPDFDQAVLLDALLACDGNVQDALRFLGPQPSKPPKPSKPSKPSKPTQNENAVKTVGYQSSLIGLLGVGPSSLQASAPKALTKKGKTLFLYSPQDIETHTPCSIIHNFLSPSEAHSLLSELLEEAKSFQKDSFQLFDRTVESPHTMSFFVNSLREVNDQKTSYVYNGTRVSDIRQSPPELLKMSARVAQAVNAEIQRRIHTFYPNGKKLKYQSPAPWKPNTSFVNCYNGPHESVGYHTDQLTYLGPRAVIGSLSLGVAREFRVRRIVPQPDASDPDDTSPADSQGQISIHLPHNSLLVMHAEMQEGWKHSIAPATAIDPHPLAENRRINVTYRHYKPAFHPRFTPKCHCDVPTVLRCVQRKKENLGRYMWMCHAGYTPGQKGCKFFKWAVFDDDGEPPWKDKVREEDG